MRKKRQTRSKYFILINNKKYAIPVGHSFVGMPWAISENEFDHVKFPKFVNYTAGKFICDECGERCSILGYTAGKPRLPYCSADYYMAYCQNYDCIYNLHDYLVQIRVDSKQAFKPEKFKSANPVAVKRYKDFVEGLEKIKHIK